MEPFPPPLEKLKNFNYSSGTKNLTSYKKGYKISYMMVRPKLKIYFDSSIPNYVFNDKYPQKQ